MSLLLHIPRWAKKRALGCEKFIGSSAWLLLSKTGPSLNTSLYLGIGVMFDLSPLISGRTTWRSPSPISAALARPSFVPQKDSIPTKKSVRPLVFGAFVTSLCGGAAVQFMANIRFAFEAARRSRSRSTTARPPCTHATHARSRTATWSLISPPL